MRIFSINSVVMVAALAIAGSTASFKASAADVEKLVEDCAYCHGKDGVSSEPTIPTIGGVSEFVLSDTMFVYQDEARPCVETEYPEGPDKGKKTDMCKIAAQLSEKEIEGLAAYYSGKPFVPAKQEFDAQKAELGQKIHDRHCEKCHADGGSSAEDDAGILAGQWMPYLEQAFEAYSSGDREMPKKMKPKYEKLDAADIDALINYYGSQQ